MATSDSDRILGAGQTVVMADGSEHIVKFEFLGMKYIEDEMGGLFAALEAFGMKFDDGQLQYKVDQTLVFNTVAKALACGLAHEFVVTDKSGKIRLPDFEQVKAWVFLNADGQRVSEYAQAGFEALIGSIPVVKPAEPKEPELSLVEESEDEPDPTPAPAMSPSISGNGGSPGAISITSPQFATVGPPTTSGG